MHNQDVIMEYTKGTRSINHTCTTIMTGKVKHECNLHLFMTDHYEHPLTACSTAAKNKEVHIGFMDGMVVGRCLAAISISLPQWVSQTLHTPSIGCNGPAVQLL